MGYVSLLEILRPKKMDTPSLRVLEFLPFKASKKNDAPFKQNSATWGSVHPWKIKCPKETSQNIHKRCWQKAKKNSGKITTYFLENVVKKLLVFPPPPPSSKGFFLIPKAAARRIFEKKKKKNFTNLRPSLCWKLSSFVPSLCWKLSSFLGVSIKTIGVFFSGFRSLQSTKWHNPTVSLNALHHLRHSVNHSSSAQQSGWDILRSWWTSEATGLF